MSGQAPLSAQGVPYLSIEETRRVMALDLAVKAAAIGEGASSPGLILNAAGQFEDFIRGEGAS